MRDVDDEAAAAAYRADAELLPHLLPHFNNVIVAGPGAAGLANVLARQRGTNIVLMGDAKIPAQVSDIDAAILLRLSPDAFIAHLRQIPRAPATLVYGVFPAALFQGGNASDELHRALSELGLGIYARVPLADDSQILAICVSLEYDPIAHARALYDAGKPGHAYRVLDLVPEHYRSTPDSAALIASEMLIAHLAWAKDLDPKLLAAQFTQAQTLFYQTIANAPAYPPAYQCQAEYWRMLGNPRMGARLLRSLLHVEQNDAAQRQYEALKTLCPAPGNVETPDPPECPETFRPRILYLLNPRPHFGLDVIYDGLCRVLGPERITDYPQKGTLHGARPEVLKNYPCCFDWPSHAQTDEMILDDLRNGAYDLVLFGDCENALPEEMVAKILAAKGETPLFIVDEMDEPTDARLFLKDRLANTVVAGYFKREMLACVDYGPGVFPLPFACPDHLLRTELAGPRDTPVFWAGHRQFGARRLYLEHLERHFGWDLNALYDPDEYTARLLDSQIGVNIFGFGFDTVRFWELPAHGCLLLSERLPIRIPHPFTHGVNAAFFDDLPELVQLLEFYMANPGAARAIARAGHAHLRIHHTGSRRAAQLLGWLHTLV